MLILPKIRTVQDLEYFTEELSQAKNKLFSVDKDNSLVPAIIKEDFLSASDKSDYIQKLEKELENAKILELTLAFYPSEAAVNKISEWAKNTISEGVILDINVDPGIFAGLVVSYNGRIKDYSFKTKFEEVVSKL